MANLNTIDFLRADDNKAFWSYPHGTFELGRYGPFRCWPKDRKMKLHFDFKNFIQNYEPSEWSYEVPEQMCGKCGSQYIDITDDTTGEVHSLARQHTPIYVNEVGHDKKLHSNVLIRDKNDRSVYYYVGIDKDHALNKGDTVELLVDYGDNYEHVRERKGYGRINTLGHVGGDDVEWARLTRNFQEREEVEADISTMTVSAMFLLIEYLKENILDPVDKTISSAREVGNFDVLRSRAIIARRRLHWIGEKLEGRYQEFLLDEDVDKSTELISSIKKSLPKCCFVSLPSIYFQLNDDLRTVLHDELTEEILYQTSSSLPSPLNDTVWSQLAVDLMKNASILIGQYVHCFSGPDVVRKEDLATKLFELVKNATEAVRQGSSVINKHETTDVGVHLNNLSFKSPKRVVKKKNLFNASKERMINLYGIEDTVTFGTAAAMADIQAYYDAVDLCGIEPYYMPGKPKRVTECERSIVSQYDEPTTNVNEAGKRSPQHHWMARSVDTFKRGDASVNEKWYLENQVLLVVHILASSCVDWGAGLVGDGVNDLYSLEKLCNEINVNVDDAMRALSLGAINPTWPKPDILPVSLAEPDQSGEDTANKSRRVRRRAGTRRVMYNGPDQEFPGWIVKAVPRLTTTCAKFDNYWAHPELPEGTLLRSKVGVRTFINYAEENNVGIGEAYEQYKDVKKWFRARS